MASSVGVAVHVGASDAAVGVRNDTVGEMVALGLGVGVRLGRAGLSVGVDDGVAVSPHNVDVGLGVIVSFARVGVLVGVNVLVRRMAVGVHIRLGVSVGLGVLVCMGRVGVAVNDLFEPALLDIWAGANVEPPLVLGKQFPPPAFVSQM